MHKKKTIYKKNDVLKMLEESNKIEGVHGQEALRDAYDAWKYASRRAGIDTSKSILKTHEALMKNIDPEIAGKVRDCDVWIGGEKKPFIHEDLIMEQIKDWLKNIGRKDFEAKNKAEQISEEEIIAWHVLFEAIHPFMDGNGRTGRIIYNVHRQNNHYPIHIIYTEDKLDYYSWFKTERQKEALAAEEAMLLEHFMNKKNIT